MTTISPLWNPQGSRKISHCSIMSMVWHNRKETVPPFHSGERYKEGGALTVTTISPLWNPQGSRKTSHCSITSMVWHNRKD
jgi:hypothetical protein